MFILNVEIIRQLKISGPKSVKMKYCLSACTFIFLIFFASAAPALGQSAPTITFTYAPEPGTDIGGVNIDIECEGEISDADTDVSNLKLKVEYYDGYYWRTALDLTTLDFKEAEFEDWTDSGAEYAYLYISNSCFEGGNDCDIIFNIRLWSFDQPGSYTDDFRVRVTVRDPGLHTGSDTLSGLVVDQGPDYVYHSVASPGPLIIEQFQGHSPHPQDFPLASESTFYECEIAKQMECNLMPFVICWHWIETEDTEPSNFGYGTYDRKIHNLHRAGIRGAGRLMGPTAHYSSPGWFAENWTYDPETYAADWREFVQATVERYDGDTDFGVPEGSSAYPRGLTGTSKEEKQDWADKHTIKHWEIYNEPNLTNYFPSASSENFAMVMREAYKSAKAADPWCVCFNGGVTGFGSGGILSWIEEMFTYLMDGGDLEPYTDFIAVHWYSFADAGWQQSQAPEYQDYLGDLEDIADLFEYYTGEKDVANTETAYAATWGEVSANQWDISPDAQANYYVRQNLLTFLTAKSPLTIWHRIRDHGTDDDKFSHTGILTYYDYISPVARKPVFYAMRNLAERLHGAYGLRQYQVVEGKYVYELWNGGQLVNAAWCWLTEYEWTNVTVDCPAASATLYSWAEGTDQLPGNLIATTVYPAADQVIFSVGQRPKFLMATLNDTDGDYLPDYFETNTGTFVSFTNSGCNPNNPDSDGDYYTDGLEIASGSDPNDSDSLPVEIKFSFQPEDMYVPYGMCRAGGDLFSSARGYGWNGQTAAVIKREPVYYTNTGAEKYFPDELMTFAEVPSGQTYYWELDLPPGKYRVSLACGDSYPSGYSDSTGPHRVVVEGVTMVDDVTTGRGEFYVDSEVITNDDDLLTVAVGGASGRTCLNYLIIRNPMVNFQTEDSLVSNPGYQKDYGLPYNAGRGYGWSSNMTSQTIERGSEGVHWYTETEDQRLSNFIYTSPSQSATFNYDLPDGDYRVSLACGDLRYDLGPHKVVVEGQQVLNQSTVAGEFAIVQDYPITVTGGQLNLTLGGSSGFSLLNYLKVGKTFDEPPPTPTPAPPAAPSWNYDYNGDGTSDIAIFREINGLWSIRGLSRVYFGGFDDLPVCGDYDGDGTTDIGIFRGASGLWAIRNVTRIYFGSSDDEIINGDYDGDGSCDAGIFRETSGLWAIKGVTRVYFGGFGDELVPGDYDGDGVKDIALFRSVSGLWALRNISRIYFGSSADELVPGDYAGDGTWAPGIFRSASGLWAIRALTRIYFGGVSDLPLPADYDGDLTDDIGIFRSSSGLWAIREITRAYYGSTGDIPVTR